jgi:hypothetical protein
MQNNISIVEINEIDLKSLQTRTVLENLPEWFGNKEALDGYVEKVREYPCLIMIKECEER